MIAVDSVIPTIVFRIKTQIPEIQGTLDSVNQVKSMQVSKMMMIDD